MEDEINYCEICGREINEDNKTTYSNICAECASSGVETIMHLLGG